MREFNAMLGSCRVSRIAQSFPESKSGEDMELVLIVLGLGCSQSGTLDNPSWYIQRCHSRGHRCWLKTVLVFLDFSLLSFPVCIGDMTAKFFLA